MNKRYTQSCAVYSDNEIIKQLKENRDARKKVAAGTLRDRAEQRGVKFSPMRPRL